MSALKEFADFVTLNKAGLAETYAELLAENEADFEAIPFDTRLVSARKLLNAVTDALDLQTSDPLIRLFNKQNDSSPRRWPERLDPGQPLVELECLGQTLTPVVTNLAAGKFLWDLLSGIRVNFSRSFERISVAAPAAQEVAVRAGDEATINQSRQQNEQLQGLAERRTRQLQTGIEVAQEIVSSPALDELLMRVVNLLQANFDYYHAHIYTLEQDELVVQAGTGQAGQSLKEAGHRIKLAAEPSLVAQAARSGEAILVPNVLEEPFWLPNPQLSDTKSELVVPIKLKKEILGVLDVQAAEVAGLDQEDQNLCVGLSDQLAVAIKNHYLETERATTQVGLIKSEQKYRELIHNLPVGIFRGTAGSDGYFLEANPAIITMLEANSKEELLMYKVSSFYSNAADGEELQTRLAEAGYLKEEEVRLKTLKGRKIWGAVTAVLKIDEAGQAYLDGIVEDITERKWVEKALRESEEKYRTILESIEDGYYEVDLTGNLTFFNDSLGDILGYPASELMGMNNREFTDEENAKKLFRTFNRVFETGQAAQGLEWEVVRKDGSRGHVETSTSLIIGPDGQPVGFRGLAHDISDRKKIESELLTSEDFLNKTIDAIPDPIFVKDDLHRWIIVNSAFCEFMGYSRQELLGKSDYDFFPKAEADVFREKDVLVFTTGGENYNEESFTDVTGETHVISTKKSVFEDASGKKILVGIIRDISDVKSAELAAQRLASREQTIREITEKLQQAPTLEALARTAAEELSRALNTSHGVVKFGLGQKEL
jgi:PAS domain S-box-containing protein